MNFKELPIYCTCCIPSPHVLTDIHCRSISQDRLDMCEDLPDLITMDLDVQNCCREGPMTSSLSLQASSCQTCAQPRITAIAKKVTPSCTDWEGPDDHPASASKSRSMSPLEPSSTIVRVSRGSSKAAAQKTAQLYQNLQGLSFEI